MNMHNDKYFALRFRSDDGVHKKGDIQHEGGNVMYIGQTPECALKLPSHADYADTCYAVIIKNIGDEGWRIVRQETTADIRINGIPLELVKNLHHGDRLTFDHTEMTFTEEQGVAPQEVYVSRRGNKALWGVLGMLAVALVAVVFYLVQRDKDVFDVFASEIESIYKIEADTLLVLNSSNDTLDVVGVSRADIGTGFVTDEGYFVTARHCVEFWLAHEQELVPQLKDIESEVVKRAIEVEMDSTLRLVAKLRIVGRDGVILHCSSDDFLMDKSRDHIYEYGDFESSYVWRSVISRYESRDAELGDVAVMKWQHGKGNIHLAESDEIMKQEKHAELKGVGYPQDNNRQETKLTFGKGHILHFPETENDCIICDHSFDHGFSGCPVFISTKANTYKVVVGIVSRSDDSHTLIVPVSAVHQLIKKLK